jgi:cyclin A
MSTRGYIPSAHLREVSSNHNAQPMSARGVSGGHCPQLVVPVVPSHLMTADAAAPRASLPPSRSSSAFEQPAPRLSQLATASSSSAAGVAPAHSPHADARHRGVNPEFVPELAQEIVDMYLRRELTASRNPDYLAAHTEVHEKMRTILIDWFVDVVIKFKLHAETYFLAVDIVDRYLTVTPNVARSQLQLVGVTAVLIAAKYEEMWAPTIAECVSITANTYTKDEVLRMERTMLAALQFKLTVPTPYPLLARLLEVSEAPEAVRHAATYFLEHAVLNYKHLRYLPSQLANASLYLANLMLHREAWPFVLQYYSQSQLGDFIDCARNLLEFAVLLSSSRYQAIRRKYTSTKYSEVARLPFPEMEALH